MLVEGVNVEKAMWRRWTFAGVNKEASTYRFWILSKHLFFFFFFK